MNIPTTEQANKFIEEGENLNPGPWIDHCKNVARAAKLIAEHHPTLDPEVAHTLGLLHDIGYRYGRSYMQHIFLGYNFLNKKGFTTAAKICLTHSFAKKDVNMYSGKCDCRKEELDFLKNFLVAVNYDDYDKLIQLCDALSLPSGFCLIEKRLMDVALRHGVTEYSVNKWKSIFFIQKEIEQKIKKSVYSILPDVIENTFCFEKEIY